MYFAKNAECTCTITKCHGLDPHIIHHHVLTFLLVCRVLHTCAVCGAYVRVYVGAGMSVNNMLVAGLCMQKRARARESQREGEGERICVRARMKYR